MEVACLEKALVTRLILAWLGEAATVRIGVNTHDAGLAAHAWVDVNGHVVDAARPNFANLIQLR